jgi:solute:Na+ symporter, SSS family
MLITFIFVYLAITILIGWFASRYVKTSNDFAIAGRRMPTYVVASGLFATWFGSETVMGASSEFVENGLLGVIEDPFGASLCLLLVGLFFAKPLYKLNIITFSDYFSLRYSKNAEWVSAIFMIPSYFSWIAAQLVAMAVVLQTIAQIPFMWGILICSAVVVFYTYIGGMWSVAITDTIQTLMIIIGLLVLMIELLSKVGGIQTMISKAPEGFFNMIPKENKPFVWLNYAVAWITVGWGSIPQQDIFQRVLSAKNEKVAVKGAVISSFMYLSVAFMPLIIAFCGKILYNDLGQDPQMNIPILVLMHSSIGMQILFFGALLSAIMSTCSGAILAPSTVVGENLVKPILELKNKKISDKSLLKVMRLSVIGIAGISAWMATLNSNIYELVGLSSAVSLVGLFIPLVAGLYWKNATADGAIASMVFGMTSWLICLIIDTTIPPVVYGLGVGVICMVVGSLLIRKKTT